MSRYRRRPVWSFPSCLGKSSLSFITQMRDYLAMTLQYLVVTVGSDVVTQVFFTRSFVYRQAGDCGQRVMGTTHATFGTGWFILLYSMDLTPQLRFIPDQRGAPITYALSWLIRQMGLAFALLQAVHQRPCPLRTLHSVQNHAPELPARRG